MLDCGGNSAQLRIGVSMDRKRYPTDHWARMDDQEAALGQYLKIHDSPFNRVMDALLTRVIGEVNGKRMLDYGCGGGYVSVWAAKAGARVTGVDIEDRAVSLAGYHARKEAIEDRCRFQTLEEFTGQGGVDHTFDLVVAKDVIEHVSDDRELLLLLAGLCAPGGRVILTTHSRRSLYFLLENTYQRLRRGNRNWMGWDPTHLRWYTPTELIGKARAAGLFARSLHGMYLLPYNLGFYLSLGRITTPWNRLAGLDFLLGSHYPFNQLGFNFILETTRGKLA